MYIFLNDPETGIVSTGIQVPYGCITSTSESHPFTYVGIGATKEERLDDDVVVTNKALSISTATFRDKVRRCWRRPRD